MKIFEFIYKGEYGGGLAIVAANSPEEAYSVLESDENYGELITEYTDLSHCNELTTISPTGEVTEPQIITSNFYSE